ncbi:6-phosphofructo-2-kinase-domain-containing protein [Umbelopsis sp. PMI_123]|nr:6-phosphofructo-2-kinase-domain-containing protein [Umbelopsis sp. PMI_123]
MQTPPQSYLSHRRKTLPIVMPDDSDPLHGDHTSEETKRPDIQQAYPPASPPTAETRRTSTYSTGPSVGLDVPGAVQTREPRDPSERQMDSKLVVVMVGLPARGKSYIVKKLRRYLTWLQYETKIFNVGNRRRISAERSEKSSGKARDQSATFFDPNNSDGKALRDELALETLEELIDWLKKGGRVAIHDATNSTRDRRAKLINRLRMEPQIKILFLESVCTDKLVLERNMRLKLSGPDYKDKDPVEALKDFKSRVANYERAYEPLGEWEEEQDDVQYCKLINVGKKVIANNISGYLSGQAVFYLMNFNLAERQIFLTRHGESLDNMVERIGGDAELSERGHKFGAALSRFIKHQRIAFAQAQEIQHKEELRQLELFDTAESTVSGVPLAKSLSSCSDKTELSQGKFVIWTSMLQRAVQTVETFNPAEYDIKHIRFLNEIYSGLREGMSYGEIQRLYPEEFAARQANKLYYRYPGMGGESYTGKYLEVNVALVYLYATNPCYLDVIHRLQSMIIELERMTQSCLIVTHRVVMRILLGYLLDWTQDEMPHMDVPIHSVYELHPKPYGTELKKWQYDEETDDFYEF